MPSLMQIFGLENLLSTGQKKVPDGSLIVLWSLESGFLTPPLMFGILPHDFVEEAWDTTTDFIEMIPERRSATSLKMQAML